MTPAEKPWRVECPVCGKRVVATRGRVGPNGTPAFAWYVYARHGDGVSTLYACPTSRVRVGPAVDVATLLDEAAATHERDAAWLRERSGSAQFDPGGALELSAMRLRRASQKARTRAGIVVPS